MSLELRTGDSWWREEGMLGMLEELFGSGVWDTEVNIPCYLFF